MLCDGGVGMWCMSDGVVRWCIIDLVCVSRNVCDRLLL